MYFNIVTWNLGRIGVASTVLAYVRYMLSKCGHEVTIDGAGLIKNGVNLVFEHFITEEHVDLMLRAKMNEGIRFGIVATELFVDGVIPYSEFGLNYRDTGFHNEVVNRRLGGYERVALGADFIWAFLERTANDSKRYCEVSEYMPFGHVNRIPPWLGLSPKDIDISFIGRATPHRINVLNSLLTSGLSVTVCGEGFPVGVISGEMTKSILDRSKIGLNLTLHAENQTIRNIDPRFVSCGRVTEMFEHDLTVVSEAIPLDNPYSKYMIEADIKSLPEVCKLILSTETWRNTGPSNSALFREDMDVVKICKPVVDRTLAAIGL